MAHDFAAFENDAFAFAGRDAEVGFARLAGTIDDAAEDTDLIAVFLPASSDAKKDTSKDRGDDSANQHFEGARFVGHLYAEREEYRFIRDYEGRELGKFNCSRYPMGLGELVRRQS